MGIGATELGPLGHELVRKRTGVCDCGQLLGWDDCLVGQFLE
jgi:hypothetical protein